MSAGEWAWSAEEITRTGRRVVDMIADYLTDLPARPVFQPVSRPARDAFETEPLPDARRDAGRDPRRIRPADRSLSLRQRASTVLRVGQPTTRRRGRVGGGTRRRDEPERRRRQPCRGPRRASGHPVARGAAGHAARQRRAARLRRVRGDAHRPWRRPSPRRRRRWPRRARRRAAGRAGAVHRLCRCGDPRLRSQGRRAARARLWLHPGRRLRLRGADATRPARRGPRCRPCRRPRPRRCRRLCGHGQHRGGRPAARHRRHLRGPRRVAARRRGVRRARDRAGRPVRRRAARAGRRRQRGRRPAQVAVRARRRRRRPAPRSRRRPRCVQPRPAVPAHGRGPGRRRRTGLVQRVRLRPDPAGSLAAAIDSADDLELLAAGLSIVCFRHRPPGLSDPAALDAVNQRILREVQLGGRAFVAATTVRGVFALRACVLSPDTTGADTAALVAAVRHAAT